MEVGKYVYVCRYIHVQSCFYLVTVYFFLYTLSADIFGTGICGTHPAFERISSRVFGGDDAEIGSWPWIGSLQQYGDHGCGCTLINSQWAVTAAHCVYVLSITLFLQLWFNVM